MASKFSSAEFLCSLVFSTRVFFHLHLLAPPVQGDLMSWTVPQGSPPIPRLEDTGGGSIMYGPGFVDPCGLLATPPPPEDPPQEKLRGQITQEILRCVLKVLIDQKKKKNTNGDLQIPEISQEHSYLPPGYSKLEVPLLLPNSTLNVDIFLNILEMLEFSEEDHHMQFSLEIIAGWRDEKIQTYLKDRDPFATEVYLSGEFLDKIWSPDIFFEGISSTSSPHLGVAPRTIVLDPKTGYVKFRSRVLLNLYCDFDFYYYPAETQVCTYPLRSYSYIEKLVNFTWFRSGVYLQRTYDYNFEYEVSNVRRKEVPYALGPYSLEGHTYAVLEFVVKSRRKLSYHLIQTYVPSVLLAVVTWLCFLIPKEQSEVRVGVAMTTLLTITAMFSSVRVTAPSVSYMKAIDIWMIMMISFVFVTLAGFLAIAWIQRRLRLQKREFPSVTYVSAEFDGKDIPPIPTNEPCPIHHHQHQPKVLIEDGGTNTNGSESGCEIRSNLDEKVDRKLVVFIPSTFLIFLVVYWTWLLMAGGYFNWGFDPLYNNVD